MNIPKFQDTGRLIGYGHINFDSEEAVEKALKFDKSDFGGRYLRIDKARGPKENKKRCHCYNEEAGGKVPKKCFSVFVKGLPFTTTEEEFSEFFEDCGEIKSARIVYNSMTKKSKGYISNLM